MKKWESGTIVSCSPRHFKALEACFKEAALDCPNVCGLFGGYRPWHCHLVLLVCFRHIGETYGRLRINRSETRRIVRHLQSALTRKTPHRHILSISNVFAETLPSAALSQVPRSRQISFNGEITEEISERLQQIRAELGVGRRDLSAVMGVSLYSVRNWEKCGTRRCRNEHIEILDAFLNRFLDAPLVDYHHYVVALKSVPKRLPSTLRTMLGQAIERSSRIASVEAAEAEYLSRFVHVMHDVTNWGDRRG
ncbi:MAG: helix-turn-helix domain-containing protein [Lentisphaeria bacterium]|nr:helix-turn-helix domain-containing protein [Lentisphaeria bacterium]